MTSTQGSPAAYLKTPSVFFGGKYPTGSFANFVSFSNQSSSCLQSWQPELRQPEGEHVQLGQVRNPQKYRDDDADDYQHRSHGERRGFSILQRLHRFSDRGSEL
jgi:hypothetical protein